jgi:hypothetical protein
MSIFWAQAGWAQPPPFLMSAYCDIKLFCSTFTRLSVQKVQFAP